MATLTRIIRDKIIEKIKKFNKIIVIYGARQVGKTTLVKQIVENLNYKTIWINADQSKYIEVLSSKDLNKLKLLVENYELLIIDEAQRIPDIGINLKILHDEIKNLKIIVTGSSSFDLAQKVTEPLTGRKYVLKLLPFSINEMLTELNKFELNNKIEEIIIYGSYPEIYKRQNYKEKEDLLYEIGNSYLFKDIIELNNIRFTRKLNDLLKLLSFQIGSEASINELASKLKLNRESVEKYIELLEKSFIIFRLSAFNRNLRKEVSKMDKFYFYDLGIRNMLINNFNSFNNRNDIGQLWENFIISERIKQLSFSEIHASKYFWRTYTGAELDYIEEKNGQLNAYEIKFNKGKVRIPKTWLETYNNSTFKLINNDNYFDFLT
ncbi:MAG: ATP-binding protein [Bacteroidota bacterium]|nr:ATP-binding protein [Bacteroidota bacterium]